MSRSDLRLPVGAARLAQMFSALVAAGLVWVAFRAAPPKDAAPVLLVAGFFASPYAFAYDLPVVTTALLWAIGERRRRDAAFSLGEIFVLLLAMVTPMTLPASTTHVPLCTVSLALLLGLLMRQLCQRRLGISEDEPDACVRGAAARGWRNRNPSRRDRHGRAERQPGALAGRALRPAAPP